MINARNKAYMRSKCAVIQLRIEQLDELLRAPDGEVDKRAVRQFMTLIRQESEDLEMHGMTNNRHKPGPRKHGDLEIGDYFTETGPD